MQNISINCVRSFSNNEQLQLINCFSSAVSTNDFNEIFIFGGTVTSGRLSDVWKFNGLDYSWEKVGNIIPRYAFSIIPRYAFSALNAFFKHQPSFQLFSGLMFMLYQFLELNVHKRKNCQDYNVVKTMHKECFFLTYFITDTFLFQYYVVFLPFWLVLTFL